MQEREWKDYFADYGYAEATPLYCNPDAKVRTHENRPA